MSKPTPISRETAVIDYLRNDPDFFKRHPGLLTDLNLPHESGSTISLIERQVALLRERNIDMRRRMNELVGTAKENDVLFSNIRTLTLALLGVASWHELNEILATHFLVDFNADFVCCHLRVDAPASLQSDRAGLALNHIATNDSLLPAVALQQGDKPRCVTLRSTELHSLFPGQAQAVTESGSAVLIPLNIGPVASLAVGSRNPDHFNASQDTLFVEYISDVTSHVVARLLR
ncbi:MAG: DUF484 family protein [Pseudomonadales bacterium]